MATIIRQDITPFSRLLQYLDEMDIIYKIIDHPECRTSIESAQARALGGRDNTIGAKALLIKADFVTGEQQYHLLILPGIKKIDKIILKKNYPDLKRFRFASQDELAHVMDGLVPGSVPPLGKVLFPKIAKTLVEKSLFDYETIGFNAACLTKSIIMLSTEYAKLTAGMEITEFATGK